MRGVVSHSVINALRVRYGDGFYAYVNRGGKYLAVIVPVYVFEGYDVESQVVEVLRRKLERTKDERKRRIITKHLTRLTTPTERTAAVDCPKGFA